MHLRTSRARRSARGTRVLRLARTATAAAHAADLALSETGSTLLYPLFQLGGSRLHRAPIPASPSPAATGSGAGIRQAITGKAQIGASDAYMSDEMRAEPQIINIPLAIAAQTVNYNLPGLNGAAAQAGRPGLAGIYTGAIRKWDAPQIAALNPGVKLPHQAIVPIRRAEVRAIRSSSPSSSILDTGLGDGIGYGTTSRGQPCRGASAAGNAGMVKHWPQRPSRSVMSASASARRHQGRARLSAAEEPVWRVPFPTPER